MRILLASAALAVAAALPFASRPAADDACKGAPCCAPPSADHAERTEAASTGCKPLAPFDVVFTAERDVLGLVDLAVDVTPREPMAELTWALTWSDGVQLLEGVTSDRRGPVAEERARLVEAGASVWQEVAVLRSSGAARVAAPDDGLHRWVTLQVTGVRRGTGPDGAVFEEPVATERRVEWGRPASPVPQRDTADADGPVRVAAMPSTHTSADGGR